MGSLFSTSTQAPPVTDDLFHPFLFHLEIVPFLIETEESLLTLLESKSTHEEFSDQDRWILKDNSHLVIDRNKHALDHPWNYSYHSEKEIFLLNSACSLSQLLTEPWYQFDDTEGRTALENLRQVLKLERVGACLLSL